MKIARATRACDSGRLKMATAISDQSDPDSADTDRPRADCATADPVLTMLGSTIDTLPAELRRCVKKCVSSCHEVVQRVLTLVADVRHLLEREHAARMQVNELIRGLRLTAECAISYIEAVHQVAYVATESTPFQQVIEALKTGDVSVLDRWLILVSSHLQVAENRLQLFKESSLTQLKKTAGQNVQQFEGMARDTNRRERHSLGFGVGAVGNAVWNLWMATTQTCYSGWYLLGGGTALVVGGVEAVAAWRLRKMRIALKDVAGMYAGVAETAAGIETTIQALTNKVRNCHESIDLITGLAHDHPEILGWMGSTLLLAKENFKELKQQAEEAKEKTRQGVARLQDI